MLKKTVRAARSLAGRGRRAAQRLNHPKALGWGNVLLGLVGLAISLSAVLI